MQSAEEELVRVQAQSSLAHAKRLSCLLGWLTTSRNSVSNCACWACAQMGYVRIGGQAVPSQRITQRRAPGGGSVVWTVSCLLRAWAAFSGPQLRCSGSCPSLQSRVRLRSRFQSEVESGQRQASEVGTGVLWLDVLPLPPGGALGLLSAEQRPRRAAGVRRARSGARGSGGPSTRRRSLMSLLSQWMQAARRHAISGAHGQWQLRPLVRAANAATAVRRCRCGAGAVFRDLPCVPRLLSHRHLAVGGGRSTLPTQASTAPLRDEYLQSRYHK